MTHRPASPSGTIRRPANSMMARRMNATVSVTVASKNGSATSPGSPHHNERVRLYPVQIAHAKGCATRGVVPTYQPLRSYAGLEFPPAMDANFNERKARATVNALARGRVHEIRRARHRPLRPRCRGGGGQPGVAVAGAKA